MSDPETRATARPRRPLFQKYLTALFVAVVVPLLANGASEAWFGYRDQRLVLSQRLHAEARSAAGKIQGFLDDITDQLQWTVQLPWRGEGTDERHRFDVLRVLRQVPAVVEVTLVDGKGVERLHVSRVDPDIVNSGIDRADDPAVIGARSDHIWYGPVTLHEGSEPHMTVAVAGGREINGVTVAEINLTLIWDVISAIHVGQSGNAFVLDRAGRLVAHPDISLVLRGDDDPAAARLKELQRATTGGGEIAEGSNAEGRSVIAAMAPIPGPNWLAFVEQPVSEAFGPIRTALWRTGLLLLVGAAFAAFLAYLLARRMTGPIRLLEQGAERIGAGQFDRKIAISTGDELEGLAARFNHMADELAVSQERSERISRLKRFLAPQVAELVEGSGEEGLLDSHRANVVVVFCDLRGFTAFAGNAEPDEVMGLLQEYYEALGAIITKYEATLTCFMADGLMLLLNAPMPRPEPALLGVRMVLEMQAAVQELIVRWQARGYAIGFGVGLAKGTATVGRIGYEGRLDYTAIGTVVNLASRLCASAEDGQILIDPAAAAEIRHSVPLAAMGTRALRGFAEPVAVFSVTQHDPHSASLHAPPPRAAPALTSEPATPSR